MENHRVVSLLSALQINATRSPTRELVFGHPQGRTAQQEHKWEPSLRAFVEELRHDVLCKRDTSSGQDEQVRVRPRVSLNSAVTEHEVSCEGAEGEGTGHWGGLHVPNTAERAMDPTPNALPRSAENETPISKVRFAPLSHVPYLWYTASTFVAPGLFLPRRRHTIE